MRTRIRTQNTSARVNVEAMSRETFSLYLTPFLRSLLTKKWNSKEILHTELSSPKMSRNERGEFFFRSSTLLKMEVTPVFLSGHAGTKARHFNQQFSAILLPKIIFSTYLLNFKLR